MVNQTVYQAIKCDGPKCTKNEIIEVSDPVAAKKVLDENPWVKNHRIVQTMSKRGPDGQPVMFHFCSDTCLVNGATAGLFVPDEEKKIVPIEGNGNAQIREALLAKARENAADAALRSGAPVQISQK
jgi:hypothetical protein